MMSGRSVGSTGCVLLFTALAVTSACGGSSEDAGSGGSGGSSGSATGGSSGSATGGSAGAATGGAGGGSGGAAGAATGGAGGAGGGTGGSSGGSAQACLQDVYDGIIFVNYDQFAPTVGTHCRGTNHQDIQGVEKLVFLGDSITVGTFPTPASQAYRALLTTKVQQKFGNIPVESCAVNGARTQDFFSGDQQIPDCFPGPEQLKTLIVITMGGNDLANMAESKKGATEALAQTDEMVAEMRAAVEWLKDPTNFPNGSYVLFANVYEYTDMTANLSSCPQGGLLGFSGEYQTGVAALVKMREQYMKIAVDTQSDMMFMGEEFCGHGFENANTQGQCYRGPNAGNWFDISCIHPTPTGHANIADAFMALIDE